MPDDKGVKPLRGSGDNRNRGRVIGTLRKQMGSKMRGYMQKGNRINSRISRKCGSISAGIIPDEQQ